VKSLAADPTSLLSAVATSHCYEGQRLQMCHTTVRTGCCLHVPQNGLISLTDFEQNNTEARLNADILVRLESWKSSPLIDLSLAELGRADKVVALGAGTTCGLRAFVWSRLLLGERQPCRAPC